nr:SRPBCC family protein [uncultured Friedmanniella sp.]
MSRVDVSTEVVIDRPLPVVAGFAGDPMNAPGWYRNIESVTWLTDPPVRVGSALSFVAHFLGRRLAYTYEVVDYQPGQRLVMRTAEGPFPMQTSYAWTKVGPGRTRMTLRNEGEPSGFSGVGAPLLAAAMRRANRKDLQALQRLLEHQSPPA